MVLLTGNTVLLNHKEEDTVGPGILTTSIRLITVHIVILQDTVKPSV